MIKWDLIIDSWNYPESFYERKATVIYPTAPIVEGIPYLSSTITGYGASGYSEEIYQHLYGSDWQYRLWYITAYGETPEGRGGDFEGDDRPRPPPRA